MGIVRRHPFLSLLVAALLSPLLVVAVITAAQHAPACAEWSAGVDAETGARMTTRYMGDGDARSFDLAYREWETTFEETRADVRAQVALERAETRPDLCH